MKGNKTTQSGGGLDEARSVKGLKNMGKNNPGPVWAARQGQQGEVSISESILAEE